MKVPDNNSELSDYSKRIDKKLRDQTVKKEAEIENIKNLYEKKIDATKIEGENQYINSIKRNDDLLIGASKNFEEKLNNYKDNLLKTQSSIVQEESLLKSDHSQKMENFKEQYQNNVHEQFQSAKDHQEVIQNQTQNSLRSVAEKAHALTNHLDNSTRAEINTLSGEYKQKQISAEREYKSTLDNNIRGHQFEMNLQKNELKKLSDKSIEKNKRLEAEKTQIQTETLNYLDNHQKDVLSQKQSDFKVRYENLVKEHDQLIAELKKHFDADVKNLTLQNSDQKRTIANKINDQFYRVETLTPEIAETQNEYRVSLKVPEHEKENVHLSVHGRSVKMTLTRKFADSVEEKDGSNNKSSRSELYSKEFSSKDILNQKQIVQKYENGILTYKIQKL